MKDLHIKVTSGVTVNAGDYQNYRPEVELEATVEEGETLEECHAALAERARQMLIAQVRELMSNHSGYRLHNALSLLGMSEVEADSIAYPPKAPVASDADASDDHAETDYDDNPPGYDDSDDDSEEDDPNDDDEDWDEDDEDSDDDSDDDLDEDQPDEPLSEAEMGDIGEFTDEEINLEEQLTPGDAAAIFGDDSADAWIDDPNRDEPVTTQRDVDAAIAEDYAAEAEADAEAEEPSPYAI